MEPVTRHTWWNPAGGEKSRWVPSTRTLLQVPTVGRIPLSTGFLPFRRQSDELSTWLIESCFLTCCWTQLFKESYRGAEDDEGDAHSLWAYIGHLLGALLLLLVHSKASQSPRLRSRFRHAWSSARKSVYQISKSAMFSTHLLELQLHIIENMFPSRILTGWSLYRKIEIRAITFRELVGTFHERKTVASR